jgi:hypothetical protein
MSLGRAPGDTGDAVPAALRLRAMRTDIEGSRSRPPVLKRAVAGLVVIAIAALAIHIVIGLVVTVFWIVLAVAAVVGVLWALNTLL